MSFSVNTNAGALFALRNLNGTGRNLDQTQSRINTGLKVSSAKDDAAAFAIAQTIRANLSGLRAVQGSLDRTTSEVDVAIAAGEAVSDLLIELRELAVAGSDSGLDANSRTALGNKFVGIRDQIDSIVNNAAFNGKNILDGSGNASALTDDSGGNTISLSATDLTLSSLNLDTTNLISIPGTPVSGTVVSLAGQALDVSVDADFKTALLNLEIANGGSLGGENLITGTNATTNVDGQSFDTDYVDGVFSALGIANQYSSAKLDGFATFNITFTAGSTVHLVRDGASSYLVNGDPTASSGSAATTDASDDALTKIVAATSTVNTALSNLGSFARRLDLQTAFSTKLSDAFEVGVGNIVDADLARESANLQAFQTKQQLGLQALSIANQAPQSVLSLFR